MSGRYVHALLRISATTLSLGLFSLFRGFPHKPHHSPLHNPLHFFCFERYLIELVSNMIDASGSVKTASLQYQIGNEILERLLARGLLILRRSSTTSYRSSDPKPARRTPVYLPPLRPSKRTVWWPDLQQSGRHPQHLPPQARRHTTMARHTTPITQAPRARVPALITIAPSQKTSQSPTWPYSAETCCNTALSCTCLQA